MFWNLIGIPISVSKTRKELVIRVSGSGVDENVCYYKL